MMIESDTYLSVNFWYWLVCTWRGSKSEGTAFNFSFPGLIACLASPESPIELRMPTNPYAFGTPNQLQFSNGVLECLRILIRMDYDFLESGVRGKFKSLATNSRLPQELQELTTD